jgi:outer membrane protein
LKHLIRTLLPVALLAFGVPSAFAADAPAKEITSTTKIGVLDWQQLFTKAPQAEEAGKRLEKAFASRKEDLTKKHKDSQAKQEKLQRDRDTMSEAERTKSEKELAKLLSEVRHLDEELRSDYTEEHRKEMDAFVGLVRELVAKIAAEEKYDLVLPQDATLFMSERSDVTEKVLERLAKAKSTGKSDTKTKK